jgi:glycosyltransferase involved in cell wall biosynthesis
VKYVVAGHGKLLEEHRQIAEEVGAGKYVIFAGRVSDEELDRLYRESALFALPSRKEGFGIVYLEAWLHHLPVIAGNADAGAEVVDDGVNGRIVDPTNEQDVAGAIVELLTDPAKAQRFGEAGHRKLHAEYGHERFAERLRAILRIDQR